VLLDAAAPPKGSEPGTTSCSPFNPSARYFGSGGAPIADAGVVDAATGRPLQQVREGQEVDLRIVARAEVSVEQPIFGFYIKDRLGQQLLGDNSFWESVPQVPIAAGETVAARFRFRWPALAKGTYALTVAIADGTMASHIQRHWVHDAVIFEVLSSSARLSMVGCQLTQVVIDRGLPAPAALVTADQAP
jgi:lipopolysaccharide transport system ATP-binding protein